MFSLEMTIKIETKTREQAEYIEKFFDDAQALVTCDNSHFHSFGINEKPDLKIDTITFELEQDAINVLNALKKEVLIHGAVSIADFYQLSGAESKFSDTRAGWRNLEGAYAREERLGLWKLILPNPVSLAF